MDSGRGITGGGSGYAALLAHAEWVLYGMEPGSVTLKINNQNTRKSFLEPNSGVLDPNSGVAIFSEAVHPKVLSGSGFQK